MLISYIKIAYYSKFTLPIGLVFISLIFVIDGVLGLTGSVTDNRLTVDQIAFSSGLLTSGFGLILRKGWAWNFAIFFNSVFTLKLLLKLLGKALLNESVAMIISPLFLFLILNLPIFIYLFKKEIRGMFPDSPVSLFILGFFLAFYGKFIESPNYFSNFLWGILFIIGLWLMGKSGMQLRRSLPSKF